MIKSFKCSESEKIFNAEISTKFPLLVSKVGKRKLDMLNSAYHEVDLRVPPSNRYERLKGDLQGYSSIRINDQYRIVFKYINNEAEEVFITDYH